MKHWDCPICGVRLEFDSRSDIGRHLLSRAHREARAGMMRERERQAELFAPELVAVRRSFYQAGRG